VTAAVATTNGMGAAAIGVPRRWPQTVLVAVLLALFAFAIFGPLANLLLWAFAEKWYFPSKLPSEFGFTFWVRVFNPRGDALASLGTSVWIAVLTVIVSLASRYRRVRARAAQACLSRADPASVPAAASGAEHADLRQHRARVLRDRPQWHRHRRRAGACRARPRAGRVDRVGLVRGGGRIAR
jgi:hypothetical protein